MVFPSWDNTARRSSPTIIQNLDPEDFRGWIDAAKKQVSNYSEQEQIVFINAWNEWNEQTCLEPSDIYEYKYLQACKDVFSEAY